LALLNLYNMPNIDGHPVKNTTFIIHEQLSPGTGF
jgi:hypothetical protein